MWAIGVYDLGLSDDAFWGMTPRRFALLLDRHKEQRRQADQRAGEIVATLANTRVDRTKRPRGFTWQDVFPEWKEAAPETEEQTAEQMFATMMLWAQVTKSRKDADT